MRDKRVYFLRPVGQLGPVKIGCSVFPEGRLDTFTLWSPVRLELACSVPGTHADEKALHGLFRKHHLHGEWFGASKELLALIDRCMAVGELPALPKVIKFPKTHHKAHNANRPKSPDRRAWAARIRAEYESGTHPNALCEQHGICLHTLLRMVRLAGGKVRPRGNPNSAGLRDMERAAEMAKRYLSGQTLQVIGDHYGLTREARYAVSNQGGWKPIETAPRDGAWVLVYWPRMSITLYPLVVFWNGDDWETRSGFGQCKPTHWMPLPETPSA